MQRHQKVFAIIKKIFLCVFATLWSNKKPILICFSISILFGVLMMGAPGFAILTFNEAVTLPYLFRQTADVHRLPADAAWPTAIMLSLIMPWIVWGFLALIKKYATSVNKIFRIAISILLTFLLLCVLYLRMFPPA